MSKCTEKVGELLLFLLLLSCLVGCAPSASPVIWQDPDVDWVYPAPPEQPRIKFLRKIATQEDVRGEDTRGQRMFEWLSGEENNQGPMISPYAVAADGKGRILMTDPGLGMVYQISIAQQRIDFFSVLGGRLLQSPTGIIFDGRRDRIYLSEAGAGVVLVFDGFLNHLSTLVPPNGFGRPAGMAVDQLGNLYVADVLNGTIEMFSVAGQYIKSIGSNLSDDGKFNHPSNVAIDPDGRLFVVDSFRFRVENLGLEGEPPVSIGSLGDTAGFFARPRGIAIDSFGHIYVSDAVLDTIQIFNRKGDLLLVLGEDGEGPDEFCLPAGLNFDAFNRFYVVDSCGHQVKIFEFLGN